MCRGSQSGQESNEEIMSPNTIGMRSLGRPSKRTRQSMRKKIVEAQKVLDSTTFDII